MNHFLSALQFLTILRIGELKSFEPRSFVAYFPIVGMILGLFTAFVDMLMRQLGVSNIIASLLDVILMIILTGAFHIDGLADTADGLYGHRGVERSLAIMKDSRIGAMGATAVFCILGMKWSGIYSLSQHRFFLIMLIPSYARFAMIFGIRFLKYGRQTEGIAHRFFEIPLTIFAFFWGIIPVFLSFFMGTRSIILNLSFCILVPAILIFYHKRIGCITGDMLGAMNEITEAVLFVVCSIGSVS